MLSSFAWLALLPPILSIIIGFVFLVTAFLCLSQIKPGRRAAPVFQTVGFLLLAVPYTLAFTSLFPAPITSIIILAASLLIITGFIIDRLRTSSPRPPEPPAVIEAKVASVLHKTDRTNRPKPATAPEPPLTPPASPPAKAIITPSPTTRSAIAPKSGLRSEPLVKLPARKRRQARQLVNILIGFFVFFLVGWGSYAIAKKILLPTTTPSLNSFQPSTPPPSPAEDQTEPTPDSQPATGPSAPPATATPSPTPSPSDQPVTTVTIKDTETGYLNVREGASTGTKIITTIDPGSTYELLDTSTNGDWYKIKLDDGNAGWIAVKYADRNE